MRYMRIVSLDEFLRRYYGMDYHNQENLQDIFPRYDLSIGAHKRKEEVYHGKKDAAQQRGCGKISQNL